MYCDQCSSVMLGMDGTKARRFKDENGITYVVYLQRYYCPSCGERFIERPDCFEKDKLYLKWIIDAIKAGDRDLEKRILCDLSTAFRWKQEK